MWFWLLWGKQVKRKSDSYDVGSLMKETFLVQILPTINGWLIYLCLLILLVSLEGLTCRPRTSTNRLNAFNVIDLLLSLLKAAALFCFLEVDLVEDVLNYHIHTLARVKGHVSQLIQDDPMQR